MRVRVRVRVRVRACVCERDRDGVRDGERHGRVCVREEDGDGYGISHKGNIITVPSPLLIHTAKYMLP